MFTLNLVYLLNNEYKKINTYIDYLNNMLKTTQQKYCIYLHPFKPVHLLNNEYKNNKKGQYLH